MIRSNLHFRKINLVHFKEVLKRGNCGGKEINLEVTSPVLVRDFEDLNFLDVISENGKKIDVRNTGNVESVVFGYVILYGN